MQDGAPQAQRLHHGQVAAGLRGLHRLRLPAAHRGQTLRHRRSGGCGGWGMDTSVWMDMGGRVYGHTCVLWLGCGGDGGSARSAVGAGGCAPHPVPSAAALSLPARPLRDQATASASPRTRRSPPTSPSSSAATSRPASSTSCTTSGTRWCPAASASSPSPRCGRPCPRPGGGGSGL